MPAETAVRPHAPRLASKPAASGKPKPGALATGTVPPYEIYPKTDVLPPRFGEKPVPGEKPQVAVIIDDLGYDRGITREFADLGAVLTFSIFPHAPYRDQAVAIARKAGFEMMLHLPMEPEEYPAVNPGPGALLSSMTPNELIRQLNEDLNSLPQILGVNNHMGSRLTTETDRMNQVFSVLKMRHLFFIDSRTTPRTVCRQAARLLQVPFAQRDVFLDHDPNPEAIRRQILRLIAVAEKHGQAIGIGHPHPNTLAAFKAMLPEIKARVTLVPASRVVHLIPYT